MSECAATLTTTGRPIACCSVGDRPIRRHGHRNDHAVVRSMQGNGNHAPGSGLVEKLGRAGVGSDRAQVHQLEREPVRDRPRDVVLADDAALHQPLTERLVLAVLGLGEDGGDLLRVDDLQIDEDLAQAGAARVDAVVVLLRGQGPSRMTRYSSSRCRRRFMRPRSAAGAQASMSLG